MLKKKAILLIHGFAGGAYDYGDLPNDLELINNYKVFTYTLPGHNKSIINNVTKDDWIKKSEYQIEKIINHGYKDIYVIGHSMGGVIASYLASKYKEVKKLVLAAPAFQYFKFENNKINILESIKVVPNLFKDYDKSEVISRIFKVPVSTIREFTSLVKEHHDDIKNIKCPTLIIHGTKDEIVPNSSTTYVYDNIKSSSVMLVEFENLTHDLFINDRYDEVKNLIINYFKSKPKNIKNKYKI
ncbi:MAG: alpha/beta hydrolase [Bacilli bacterium]